MAIVHDLLWCCFQVVLGYNTTLIIDGNRDKFVVYAGMLPVAACDVPDLLFIHAMACFPHDVWSQVLNVTPHIMTAINIERAEGLETTKQT